MEGTLKHSLKGRRVQREAFQRFGPGKGGGDHKGGRMAAGEASPQPLGSELWVQLRAVGLSDQEADARRQL